MRPKDQLELTRKVCCLFLFPFLINDYIFLLRLLLFQLLTIINISEGFWLYHTFMVRKCVQWEVKGYCRNKCLRRKIYVALVSLFLTLNKSHIFLSCFYCRPGTSKCLRSFIDYTQTQETVTCSKSTIETIEKL